MMLSRDHQDCHFEATRGISDEDTSRNYSHPKMSKPEQITLFSTWWFQPN